jgi:chromosome segregation ATPase
MSFEMKYDRDRNPVKDAMTIAQEVPQDSVVDQLESQEAQSDQAETQETEVMEQPEQPVVKISPEKQANIRELRLKAEQAERERDELKRRLLEIEQQKLASQQIQQPVEDDEVNLAPDDLAEGKHLSKVGRKIKKLEEQLRHQQYQTQTAITEAKLKQQYADFDQVVCKDNLDRLRSEHPEIAETIINSGADLYSKGVSAYSMIKKLGIVSELEAFKGERQLVHKNANKPRPSVSLSPQQGESPLHKANAFANGLTDDLKTQLRKEMEEARRAM